MSGRPTDISSMLPTIELDKFKGDGTQDVNAWLVKFFKWVNFYNLLEHKVMDVFPYHLEGNAKIWYDALPCEDKSNPNTIKILFQERFKQLDNFLDLSILEMKQNIAESVSDYLSRIIKVASIKNIPEKVLLSVALNGLRSDIKPFVVTQNPKTMEQIRQTAILAEKSQPPQTVTVETYENLLTELKSLKDQLFIQSDNVNTMQQTAPQKSFQVCQNYSSSRRVRNWPQFKAKQTRTQQHVHRNMQRVPRMRPLPFQPRSPLHAQGMQYVISADRQVIFLMHVD